MINGITFLRFCIIIPFTLYSQESPPFYLPLLAGGDVRLTDRGGEMNLKYFSVCKAQ